MTRREELLKVIGDNEILLPLVDRVLFLEEQLEKLEKLPLIRIDPKNPERQKATPAAKMYKEYLQQYINAIKAIEKTTNAGEDEEESPLRKWVSSRTIDDIRSGKGLKPLC